MICQFCASEAQANEVVKISEDLYNHILDKMKETHDKIEFD